MTNSTHSPENGKLGTFGTIYPEYDGLFKTDADPVAAGWTGEPGYHRGSDEFRVGDGAVVPAKVDADTPPDVYIERRKIPFPLKSNVCLG